MMQLPLLVTGAAAVAGAGAPVAAGSDGSGFGAVLGEVLAGIPVPVAVPVSMPVPKSGPDGSASALPDPATPGAGQNSKSVERPDGGAAAPETAAESVPDIVPALVPAVMQAAVALPVPTPQATQVRPPEALGTAAVEATQTVGAHPGSAAGLEGRAVPGAPTAVSHMDTAVRPDTSSGAATAPTASTPVPNPHPLARPSAALNAPFPARPAAASLGAPLLADQMVPADPAPATAPQPEAPVPPTFAPVLPSAFQSVPVQQSTPAPPAPLPDHGRLTPQLAGPLFTLASAAPGAHVMTLKVSPEDLGPLTVRAHIDATGVRIELFAPGDAGRDAVRTILPELRRGLAESGLGASLNLSDHGAPPDGGAGGPGQDRRAPQGSQPLLPSVATAEPAHPGRLRAAVVLPGNTPAVLDILV